MTRIVSNRREFIKIGAAATALLAAPGYLRRASAQTGGEVNIWGYPGFVPEAFQAKFQEETGIKVNLRLVADQGRTFNLLSAEQPNPSVDIVTVSGHRFLQFIDNGLVEPLDVDRLENYATIDTSYSEGDWAKVRDNRWGIPILGVIQVLAYNPDMADADDAQSWNMLFSEKYEKQISYIIQDTMSTVLLYLGHDGNMIEYMDDPERAAAVVNEARDFMIAHKHLVRKYYDAPAEIQQMFINRDVVVGQSWNGPVAKLIADGLPVRMTVPKEGSFASVYNLNITRNAPNPDNAYRFLDALMASPEHGAQMSRESGFISTFVGASDYLTEAERASKSLPPEEIARLVFRRAEAVEMKYELIDRAVEEIRAA